MTRSQRIKHEGLKEDAMEAYTEGQYELNRVLLEAADKFEEDCER